MSNAVPQVFPSFQAGPSPLSPTSPPTEGVAKPSNPTHQPPDDRYSPHTPTSPPLMSLSSQNYASNFSATQVSPPQTASQSATIFSSPPSSTTMSTQTSQQPTLATTNSFPTPASSVSGQFAHVAPAEETDGAVKDASSRQSNDNNAEDLMDIDASSHRRTDHDRQRDDAGGTAALDENPMDVDHEMTSPARDGGLDPASLQEDIGTAFHVCKSSYTASGPNPSWDLVSLYGLGPVAASVARTDPVTGEKINRLRKSYEGKIKGLGLAGRNKPVKNEVAAPGTLRHMTLWPEEEWHNQKVYGKEIKVAESDSSFYKLLTRAMKMEPGRVPNHEFWEDALGHEKPLKHIDALKKPGGATPGPVRPTTQANGAAPVSTPTHNRESGRPKRTGKKRSYNDSSFVGYGEGFPDDGDDLDGGLYSNSEEGGRGSGKKKRKKDHISGVSPPLERGGSYGVGMFGVGAR
ncbi:hypothetical protein AJ80_08986 [Polytolypa hystricis UAMH7299]|uniref:Mediator of RNA polymerase II transcription subunit 19 n=1 Tax=Polytolypa hystricis (strain UAMH7299) TaxID=1447883 RepID=A0A2B7WYI2_POLH7|nr:hypothetical protein AJ80_08986 [Polytolypa hystricis UAMH7299]